MFASQRKTASDSPRRSIGKYRSELSTLNDSQVVQKFLDGEERAFGELVDRYDTRLVNFVYRTVGDRERAQDLVQETFVRVYRHLHRFDQTKKFSTWIYTIASNLAKNELRNRSRNPLVLFQTIRKNCIPFPANAAWWVATAAMTDPCEWAARTLKPPDSRCPFSSVTTFGPYAGGARGWNHRGQKEATSQITPTLRLEAP
jgi:RNA polymerase sigma factor (sigma-70 family)